jgi:hypothetical protein
VRRQVVVLMLLGNAVEEHQDDQQLKSKLKLETDRPIAVVTPNVPAPLPR